MATQHSCVCVCISLS